MTPPKLTFSPVYIVLAPNLLTFKSKLINFLDADSHLIGFYPSAKSAKRAFNTSRKSRICIERRERNMRRRLRLCYATSLIASSIEPESFSRI